MSEAEIAKELADIEQRAARHFDDVERAIQNSRLGELLKDVPSVAEQARQAKESLRAGS